MPADITYVLGEKGKDIFPTHYVENNLVHAIHKRKLFLGNREKKVCRFCHRDSSSTTFRKDAHLLPEFMGNNILFSYFECDQCNSLFSKYETAFSNFFHINHTFAHLKGKNKVPQFKNKKDNFRVIPEGDGLNIISGEGNNSVTIDEHHQMMRIKTRRPSYVPCDIMKCLVKIGLGAVRENELHHFEMTRKWLMNCSDKRTQITPPLSIFYYNIGGGLQAKSPFVVLFNKREGSPVPQSAVLISYDHFKLQFFMPFDLRDEVLWRGDKVSLPIQGNLVRDREDGKGLSFYWKDLSGTEKVIGEEHIFSTGITYGKFIK